MANLAIKGHATRGNEVIEILKMLDGIDWHGYAGSRLSSIYYVSENKAISFDDIYDNDFKEKIKEFIIFTIEEFEKKFPYKIGDRVTYIYDGLLETQEIINMRWDSDHDCVLYYLDDCNVIKADDILYQIECPEDNIPAIQDKTTVETIKEDKGNISDGYHTFNELYEYRLLYNASMFNELAKQNLYDVHKSKLHSDGTIPFGDENWFIVQAELPTGQISNHHEMKDWDLFQVPIKEKANPYDGHTPHDVAKRLREFLTPKPQYPKTYTECCECLSLGEDSKLYTKGYKASLIQDFQKLLICRNAYWEIAGKELGLDKPWEPQFENCNIPHYCIFINHTGEVCNDCFYGSRCLLSFPTSEMRDAFYENFEDLIKYCKELL